MAQPARTQDHWSPASAPATRAPRAATTAPVTGEGPVADLQRLIELRLAGAGGHCAELDRSDPVDALVRGVSRIMGWGGLAAAVTALALLLA